LDISDNVYKVFNNDGEKLDHRFNKNNGIITILPVKDSEGKETIPQADNANITGYINNNLCDIITDLIERKSNITKTLSNWNINELNRYRIIAPCINVSIESGNVKNTISNLLKNDMTFLIQQTTGKLTIRRYGEKYGEHEIPSWCITKKPEIIWASAQEYYFSSCKINYGYTDSENYLTLLFNKYENDAEDMYRRRVLKTFDTDLFSYIRAYELAKMLTSRYLIMKQTIKLSTGYDTSNIELLDTVITDFKINDRLFGRAVLFFTKEIDHAQDILSLEELLVDGALLVTENFEFITTDDGKFITV